MRGRKYLGRERLLNVYLLVNVSRGRGAQRFVVHLDEMNEYESRGRAFFGKDLEKAPNALGEAL